MTSAKHQRELEALRQLPDNKICFTCSQQGPMPYVNLSFLTWVCSDCANPHREYSHRLKSVTMSTFTEEDMERLKTGGNKAAKELWLARMSSRYPLPTPGNIDRVKDFIQRAFVKKTWVSKKSPYYQPSSDSKKTNSETKQRNSVDRYSAEKPSSESKQRNSTDRIAVVKEQTKKSAKASSDPPIKKNKKKIITPKPEQQQVSANATPTADLLAFDNIPTVSNTPLFNPFGDNAPIFASSPLVSQQIPSNPSTVWDPFSPSTEPLNSFPSYNPTAPIGDPKSNPFLNQYAGTTTPSNPPFVPQTQVSTSFQSPNISPSHSTVVQPNAFISTSQSMPHWKIYKAGNFSAAYPDDWTFHVEDRRLIFVSQLQSVELNVRDNITVEKLPSVSLEDAYDKLSKRFHAFPASQVFPSVQITVPKARAVSFKARYMFEGANFQQLTAIADFGSFSFVISYLSSAVGFPNEVIFNHFMEKLVLE